MIRTSLRGTCGLTFGGFPRKNGRGWRWSCSALSVEGIDHEVDYYESIQSGLGVELEDEVEAALATIRRFANQLEKERA